MHEILIAPFRPHPQPQRGG